MKKAFIIIALLIFGAASFGQGIVFQDLAFEEALAKAKKENKYVFMDCYTYWCAPCKSMRDNIFPKSKCGDYFNPKFICVEYDFAQPEYKHLGEKYGITAYPTYLILRPDGTVYHKIVGGKGTAEEFIEMVKRGMNKKYSLSYLDERYEKGKMNKEELRRYIVALKEANEGGRHPELGEQLLARLTDKEKMEAKYWTLFERKKFGSEEYNFIVANVETFQANVGKKTIDNFLYRNYDALVNNYLVRLQNGSLTDFSEPLKVTSDAYQELSGIDMNKKPRLMELLAFLKAYFANDTQETVDVISQMLTSDKGNRLLFPKIMEIIRKQDNKPLMMEILRSKERILAPLPDMERERVERELDRLKKLV